MPYSPPDTLINRAEGVVLATVLGAYALALISRFLRRSRPELCPSAPLAAAYALRLAAMAGISASGLGTSLRGGDEVLFLADASRIAAAPFSVGAWAPGRRYPLHEIVFAVQIKLGDLGESALRVTQIGIALVGLLLLAAAVHDLAGTRPARLTLWLLALEPGGIFFSQLLHKEPLMVLASGLVAFGGARAWRRSVDPPALAILAAGSGIAILTRPYAGWFLASAAVAIVLHSTLRDAKRSISALAVLACLLAGIAAAVPTILQVTSKQSLQANLQASQNANTTAAAPSVGGPNGNNLALEQVDYSTRGAIITNLPIRVRDLLLRPYPWQLANTSERLGALGTLVSYVMLLALARYGLRARRESVRLVGPLLYPLGFLLIAYALSVGNAGTGFRYRSHLVTLGLAIAVILREHCLAHAVDPLPPRGVETANRGPAIVLGRRGWPNRPA